MLGVVHATDRASCDLATPESIRSAVRSIRPAVIVNAGAFTAVDKAESDLATAAAVNAIAPAILGEEAMRLGALVVHYSTDYVFDGSGKLPRFETEQPSPLNAYGKTKADGESALRAACARHLILRTSWVFGACGANFPRTIIRLACERESLSVVSDQWGAPTPAHLIADVTAHLVARWLATRPEGFEYGTYHLASAGETNWHGLARYVVKRAREGGWPVKAADDAISGILTKDYRSAAQRPLNSRLDTSLIRNTFGVSLPLWQDGIDFVIRHWQERP
jgi:dTDP-4-dehydrorhamnose reductase